jgi:ribonuclease-3
MTDNPFKTLEKKIGLTFKDRDRLQQVFIHKSYLNECKEPTVKDNERLEFLGDAVLELLVTEFLFKNYPNPEGELTNWRSALVRGAHLAHVSRQLELGQYLVLSNGEERSGGREKGYILANTFEALLGAIYLDFGYDVSHKFVDEFLLIYLEEILEKGLHIDPKSKFQEMAQDKENQTPQYKLVNDEGPDHDKVFNMGVYLGEELVACGKGSSKQNAEQEAALAALQERGWHK